MLIHQIPADPAYLRVKVGRRLARVGAIALKNSVYVLPASEPCREDFTWTRREVVDGGGEAMLFEATAVEGMTAAQIERMFRDARAKDYAALESALTTLGRESLVSATPPSASSASSKSSSGRSSASTTSQTAPPPSCGPH